jgi:hypothetical protein
MAVIKNESLPVPALLKELIRDGKWSQPPDELVARAFPMIADAMYFFEDDALMLGAEFDYALEKPSLVERFRVYRGSNADVARDLPWLDLDMARVIAINRVPGEDAAIALDYRNDIGNPRVVASAWSTDGAHWVEAYPTFEAMASALQLL